MNILIAVLPLAVVRIVESIPCIEVKNCIAHVGRQETPVLNSLTTRTPYSEQTALRHDHRQGTLV
jgi:hypothetical protein